MGNKIEAYIQEYMKVTEKQLIERPQHIARDFNIESSMTRDYAGRQLLELIQNADDAAVSAVKKHMLILIDEEKLIVANNGEPFTKEGFDSLFFSHLSPKIHDESIGHKGLGFRAVLSWAHEITIYSSGITVRFSEEIAQEFWDRIKTHNGLEDRVLRSTNKDIGECPIAMLSIPQIVAEPRPGLPDYDTVIELTLRPDILDEVEAQLEEIMQPEALLFFNQLDQVKIVNHGSETIITRKIENTPAGKKSTVSIKKPDCKEPTVKTWHLLEHQWVTRVNQQTNKDHIIMAYNEELDDDVNSLYSYYPTNVEFTAPFIVHASFDVTSDRKGLSDGSSKNKDIFRELAGFICRSAEKLASDGHYDPGFALRFLGIDKNGCDSIAYRMGFFEALQKHLSSCKIIPTVNDEFISFDDGPKVLPKHICSYFSGNDVWDLVNGDHIKSFKVLMQLVDRQEVVYNIDKLCSMIHQRARKLPARSLVYLYLHLAEKYEKELFKLSYCDPIMLNIDGEYIDPKSQVFFSLDNKVIYDIPNDLAIDFLDEAVSQELAEGGNLEKMENAFGVHHYSFNEIANILISNYNEKDNVEDIKAMHRALFQVYSVATASKEDTDGVETGNVRLISKNGSIVTANEVYFGEGYDNRLTETIYRDLPHKILGAPEMIGLQKEGKQELIKYLAWLGVEKYPRLKEDYTNKINYGDNAKRKEALEFIKHIVLNYNYKEYKIGEYSFRDYSEFNEKQGLKDWGHIYKFTTVDELEAILKDIKVETLMEWILADKKLRKMLSEDHDTGGSLRVMIGNNRNFRDIDTRGLRSYIRWKMANSPLLTDPVNPEKKLTPNQCCIAKTMRPEYYPYLVQPKVDTERLMDSLKITGADIDKLLIDIGVHESIKTLSTEALYKILGSLPESDPEGKKARSIYHEILNYDERLLDEEDETYRKFKESGKVLCRVGPKTEYVSVKDAYYLVNRHSQDIQSKFKLIDLEYKRGREKVSKLFCVKIVGKIDVRLMDKVDHPLNQELQKFLVEAKDYIYTIMHGSDTKGEILEALMNTEIIMATSVRAEMTHVGKISEINLSPDEYIHITNDNSYYICVDQEIDDFESLRRNVFLFSNSLSLIFASITGRDSDQMHRIIGEDKNNWGCFLQTIFEDEFENELKIAREKIDEYKSEQNNEQHIRFWNIFSSCVVDVSDDVSITNEDELNSYLTKMFPEAAQESWIRESADYTRLSSTIQEKIFKLIRSVPIDFERLSGYYPQLDFREMIRQDLIEIQNRYTPAFKLGLYHKLKDDAPESKDTYFDECERYVELFNTNAEVPKYAYDIEDYFMKKVEEQFGFELGDEEKLDTLDIDEKLRANKVWWEEEYGIELNEEVLQSNMVKSLLLFAEYEAFTEEVSELDDRVAKSVAALRAEAGIEEQSPELDIPKVHHTTSAIEYVQPQGESEEMADRVAATEDQESDDEGKSSTPQQSHGQHRTAIRPAISAAVAERAQYGVKERTTSYDSSQRVSDNTDRTAIARSGEDEKSRVIVVDGMELDFENDHISGINRSLDELAQRLNNSLKDSATPGMITSQSKSGAGSGSSGGSGVSQESRNSVYIGYAAEYLAYKVLKNKYGATSVEWLSENAKRAEVNEDGRAGCGYDIGVKVNGMDRYVEVKAITNPSIGFEITGNELRFAEENADRYDILMVQSITENPQLVYIKSFFDIPDKEKLTNNSRFTLELPSARIRFELKGE